MSGQDKTLISDMMEGFVSEAPPTPFVSYCVVCNVFLTQEEMVYEKGLVFHKDCFAEHGKDYPVVNYALNSLNRNAKVQLVKLKNLKIRQMGGLDQKSSRSKPKIKSKSSKKKIAKRKTVKKRKSSSKKKGKKQKSRKKPLRKKRIVLKRRKPGKRTSKPSRRSARKTTRKTRRRR